MPKSDGTASPTRNSARVADRWPMRMAVGALSLTVLFAVVIPWVPRPQPIPVLAPPSSSQHIPPSPIPQAQACMTQTLYAGVNARQTVWCLENGAWRQR